MTNDIISAIEARIGGYQNIIASLEKQMHSLLDKVDDLENRSRRNILVIFEVTGTTNKAVNSLRTMIEGNNLEHKLEGGVKKMERAHQIGRRLEGKT